MMICATKFFSLIYLLDDLLPLKARRMSFLVWRPYPMNRFHPKDPTFNGSAYSKNKLELLYILYLADLRVIHCVWDVYYTVHVYLVDLRVIHCVGDVYYTCIPGRSACHPLCRRCALTRSRRRWIGGQQSRAPRQPRTQSAESLRGPGTESSVARGWSRERGRPAPRVPWTGAGRAGRTAAGTCSWCGWAGSRRPGAAPPECPNA